MNTIFQKNLKVFQTLSRINSRCMSCFILGIESSCDETGAAIVDESGTIHGQALSSQLDVHLEYGGVIPHIAAHLHEKNIEKVVSSTFDSSRIDPEKLSAVAVTTKPGLKASLKVGLEYSKSVATKFQKPLIPIHHMEAHSLTVRMVESVTFPYIVLLASGGHCQIAVVKDVTDFVLLGTTQNNAPGEVLDKIARRLKLQNLPECSKMSGGRAIEHLAKQGDFEHFHIPHSMAAFRDCNFSFSGYASYAVEAIEKEERKHDVAADGLIPFVEDFCASIQHAFTVHLIHRLQRAFIFCHAMNLIPPQNRTLVFSGGVASNEYIRNCLKELCETEDYRFLCPPPILCTDNGIMVAWNGVEKFKCDIDVCQSFEHIVPESDAPLGADWTQTVKDAKIKVKVPKVCLGSSSSVEVDTELKGVS